MSEIASDAWSTDVLASDTSERQSERLLELEQVLMLFYKSAISSLTIIIIIIVIYGKSARSVATATGHCVSYLQFVRDMLS